MTRAAIVVTTGGFILLAIGLFTGCPACDLAGGGLLCAVPVGCLALLRPPPLSIERTVAPDRVTKGSLAVTALVVTNRARRRSVVTAALQPVGEATIRLPLPQLGAGERGLRAYRLPTSRRGVLGLGPVTITQRDPFGVFGRARRFGGASSIRVTPRIVWMAAVPGAGTVLGGHGVVLLDLDPDGYRPESVEEAAGSFEEAVDVVASIARCTAAGDEPVELRCTDGSVARERDVEALIDHLVTVQTSRGGSVQRSLAELRDSAQPGLDRAFLVVVCATLDAAGAAELSGLRHRFGRVIVVCLGAEPPPAVRRVAMINAPNADGVAAAWNAALLL